jgi:hypothetical protein
MLISLDITYVNLFKAKYDLMWPTQRRENRNLYFFKRLTLILIVLCFLDSFLFYFLNLK